MMDKEICDSSVSGGGDCAGEQPLPATPRPWQQATLLGIGPNGQRVFHCGMGRRFSDEHVANAALIVRAVNVHDDLVVALTALLHEVEEAGFETAKDYGWPLVIPQARAALAKALSAPTTNKDILVDELVALVTKYPGSTISWLGYKLGKDKAAECDDLIRAAEGRIRVEERPYRSGTRSPRRYLYPLNIGDRRERSRDAGEDA